MKNIGYFFMDNPHILTFSDVYTLIEFYQDLDEKYYIHIDEHIQKERDYVYIVIESLLKEFNSKYSISDYVYSNFIGKNVGPFLSYLFVVRNSKYFYVKMFSGDLIGDRSYIHDNVDLSFRTRIEEVKKSNSETEKLFLQDIFSIDELICDCIGENFRQQVTFGELKKKYFPSLEFPDIHI